MSLSERLEKLRQESPMPNQTDQMQAGAALDAMVAEKVMGWTWYFRIPSHGIGRRLMPPEFTPSKKGFPVWQKCSDLSHSPEPVDGLPPYSTQIAYAMTALDKMIERGFTPTMWKHARGETWSVSLEGLGAAEEYCYDESLPLAICRCALAALKAVDENG